MSNPKLQNSEEKIDIEGNYVSRAWWCMPGRLRKEDLRFKASLSIPSQINKGMNE
jgi:hypothetical protein